MLCAVNVGAGVFFNCYKPGIRPDFKQYYETFGKAASICSRSGDHVTHEDPNGSFNFGLQSEMVAGLFKEWLEGQLRELKLSCQEAGEHHE